MDSFDREALAGKIEALLSLVIVAAVVLVPVFFLPLTSEFFIVNKHLLTFVLAGAALLLWTGSFVLRQRVTMTISPILLPLFLVAATAAASVIFGGGSVAESLLGRVGLFSSFLVLLVVGSSQPARLLARLIAGLIAGAAVTGGLTIWGRLPGFEAMFGWGAMTGAFSPTGNMMTTLVMMVVVLPLVTSRIKGGLKRKKTAEPTLNLKATNEAIDRSPESTKQAFKKLGLLLAMVLILAGGATAAIEVVSDFAQMPLSISWQVAVETLKEEPIFGVGVASYFSVYNRFRPLSTNLTDIWNRRFLQAPNELFQTFTTTGILGLAALLFWLGRSVFLLKSLPSAASDGGEAKGLGLAVVILLLSLLLAPFNVVTMSLMTTLLTGIVLQLKRIQSPAVYEATIGFVALREGLVRVETSEEPAAKVKMTPLAWILFVPALILALLTFWLSGRVWAAEMSYRQVLDAIAQNDGTGAYNNSIITINRNPWFDNYHRQYAEVNLRLANSLASREDLTDQDRANVTRLIQQAIREAKIAVQLDPADVQNWEALARIYRSLINVAQGAAEWTLITYSEAIRRDPANPLLRLELGGVFFNLGDLESANRNFQTTVNLKPDFANGYFNLALGLEQSDRLPEAVRAIQAALQNLEPGSGDYRLAQDKLEELLEKAQPPQEEASPAAEPEELSGPEPLPTPPPGTGPVELSEEEAPPLTPSPSPRVSPTPTPTRGG